MIKTTKIGRNDPCPCGSGKKYKHCCLSKRHAHLPAAQASPAHTGSEHDFETQLALARSTAQSLLPHVSSEKAQELETILQKAREIADYQKMSGEIEAAARSLEKHEAEFRAMLQSPKVVDRTQRLFAEAQFVPYRFTADDAYRAFEAVGYPKQLEVNAEKNQAIVEAAILHLVDKDQRIRLARQLMMLLPEYVAAGRHFDAALIQHCAWQTLDYPDRINAFLYEMFHYGFQAWATQIGDQKKAILRELGFNLDQIKGSGMNIEELEAQVQAQMVDPEKKAQLEAYFARHAMMSAQAGAEVWELEKRAVSLLEREDAGPLYLTAEEMQPWIEPLLDRLEPFQEQGRRAAEQGRFDDPALTKAFNDIMIGVSKEMAATLFTPERVAQLAQTVQAYRHDLLAAQDRQAATYAHGALLSLEHYQDPSENPLLFGICFASLRALLVTAIERKQTQSGS